jgi:hypothetical protein
MNGRRWAPGALVVGGLLSAALHVPFTITHGPTSFNREDSLWGLDMHGWGFLLGTIPSALLAVGLWLLRDRIASGSKSARIALTVVAVAFAADTVLNLAVRALGAPFALLVIGPALLVATAVTRGPVRLVVGALALVTCTGIGVTFIPQETQDHFGGYRIYGTLVHVVGGLLWSTLGLLLTRSRPSARLGGRAITRH